MEKKTHELVSQRALQIITLAQNRHMRLLSCLDLFVWAWEKQRREGRMVRASGSCIHRCSCKNILIHMFPSTCLFPGNLALQHRKKHCFVFILTRQLAIITHLYSGLPTGWYWYWFNKMISNLFVCEHVYLCWFERKTGVNKSFNIGQPTRVLSCQDSLWNLCSSA